MYRHSPLMRSLFSQSQTATTPRRAVGFFRSGCPSGYPAWLITRSNVPAERRHCVIGRSDLADLRGRQGVAVGARSIRGLPNTIRRIFVPEKVTQNARSASPSGCEPRAGARAPDCPADRPPRAESTLSRFLLSHWPVRCPSAIRSPAGMHGQSMACSVVEASPSCSP